MHGAVLEGTDLHAVQRLIVRLHETAPLTVEGREAVRGRHIAALRAGTAKPSILSLFRYLSPEDAQTYIQQSKNSLLDQVAITDEALDRWFSLAETAPPFYPWRIAVLLRRAGEAEMEKAFLAGYLRQFDHHPPCGARDITLRQRARRLIARQ